MQYINSTFAFQGGMTPWRALPGGSPFILLAVYYTEVHMIGRSSPRLQHCTLACTAGMTSLVAEHA